MMKQRTLFMAIGVLALLLVGNVAFWAWTGSDRAKAGTALKTVDVQDLQFNALVVTYVKNGHTGTTNLQVRLDYEYLMSDNQTMKNTSRMITDKAVIDSLTVIVNNAMSAVRTQEVATPGKLYSDNTTSISR